MSKITGLGGVFLSRNGDTKKLLNWYHEVLGLDITEYGINFLVPNKYTLITFDNEQSAEAIFNFTVDDLEDFLETLKMKHVKILDDIQEFEYGKFAQIEDILGNRIELWQPNDEAYKKMVKKEIEDFNKKNNMRC